MSSHERLSISISVLKEHSHQLVKALDGLPIPELSTALKPHYDALSKIFYKQPTPDTITFQQKVKSALHPEAAQTLSTVLVRDAIRQRLFVPDEESITIFMLPILQTVTFRDPALTAELGKVIGGYLHQHIPGLRSTVDLTALHGELWWALIALYGWPASSAEPLGCNPLKRRWRNPIRRKPRPTAESLRLHALEKRLLATAYDLSWGSKKPWADFWEQWILVFAWHRWQTSRAIPPELHKHIEVLPLREVLLPNMPRYGISFSKTGIFTSPIALPEWRKTSPTWFTNSHPAWFKL